MSLLGCLSLVVGVDRALAGEHAGTLPTSCGHPLEHVVVVASPLAAADLARFIEVNRSVVEKRVADAAPGPGDYLKMLEALAWRSDELAAQYADACERLEVSALRYLKTERRVRQVAELLSFEARQAEHRAERLVLEDASQRAPLDVVEEHREAIFRVDRSRILDRIQLLEGALAGDATSLAMLTEQIESLDARVAALTRKIAKQLERREELESLASRHGLDSKRTARALDKLEGKIGRYRERLPELERQREQLEEGHRRLMAANLAPMEDVRSALTKAHRELGALDSRMKDPQAVKLEVQALERHLSQRGAELGRSLASIEVRMSQPDMQQAERDREAVLDHMPELRGLYRLLPSISDSLAERLAGRASSKEQP